MKNYFVHKLLILFVMVFFLSPSVSPTQELISPSRAGEVIVGEKLDSSAYGPGFVEHMDVCIARGQLRGSTVNTDFNKGGSQHGSWLVPSREASYFPHSGTRYVMNNWGDTRMGIAFPTEVDVHGAWFAGQGGGDGVWARSIRVIGFRDGEQVQMTGWFGDIDTVPSWFAMDLFAVDRIVIEATPVFHGAGWYAMDDLTYTPVLVGQGTTAAIVVDFEDCFFNQDLSSSNYAGLIWEMGTGDFFRGQDDTSASQSVSNADITVLSGLETYTLDSGDSGRNEEPTLLSDFQGVIRGDASSWSYPPDSCGAVGPDHFVEVVNRNFAVYEKSTGAELINILLGDFLPGSNGDPRVLFDQFSDRWFVIVCDFNTLIYLAVSISDDPTGAWFKCSFVVSQGSDAGKWPDYPTLGVDSDGVYTAAYMVGGSSGMSIFALVKAPLIAPNPSVGDIYAFRELPWEGAIQPVHT
ncbi:MAG: hypothetical protein KKC68_01695, partial [Candidatus Thermoplasmatota archaeon]|nr:hypothetical protein [Candidatus Thermoplasmatota archaeon]